MLNYLTVEKNTDSCEGDVITLLVTQSIDSI
jgi:hypothetical protein